MGILLFQTGVLDGTGVISSTAVLTGDGNAVLSGTGTISSVAVLVGSGAIRYDGVGTIICVSVLTGQADVITPVATYLFTILGSDGVLYQFTAENDEASVARYTGRRAGGEVEYKHLPRGRTIP